MVGTWPANIVKSFLIPGSVSFLCIILFLCGVLARRKWHMTAAALGVALSSGYLLLSLPFVAHSIPDLMSDGTTFSGHSLSRAPMSVVVLGGDNPNERIDEARRLLRSMSPQWVIVSGVGEWMKSLREGALSDGLPPERLIVEPRGRTTRQQSLRIQAILRSKQINTFTLVVSKLHMRRALATFRALGLCPVGSPSATEYGERVDGWRNFLPQAEALAFSRDALYENFALWYYRWRGWSDKPGQPRQPATCSNDEWDSDDQLR